MRLSNKLILLVVSILFFIFIGVFYFQSTQIRKHLTSSQLEWVDTLSNSLSESIARDTINGNKLSVTELLQRLVKDDAVEYVYVTDMDGQLFAHSFKKGMPRFLLESIKKHSSTISKSHIDKIYETKQGIISELDAPLIEGLAARIHLGVNQNKVNMVLKNVREEFVWFFSILGIISILIAVIIASRINKPLINFAQKLLVFNKSKLTTFPEISTTDPDIINLVNVFHDVISEREKADEALAKLQQRLILHRELSPLGIIEWTTDLRFVDFNPAAQKIFGFSKKEVLGQHVSENILPESARKEIDKVWRGLLTNTGGVHSINENITKDGRVILCEWNNTPLINEQGKVVGVASYVEDITNQQQEEQQVRRAQKMDALGKLTGGISHDFNNILGVIMGYAELLQLNLKEQSNLLEYANEIMHASERGAKLTQKLLAFSKKKVFEADEVNLNEVILSNKNLLEKTLTARIKLVLNLEDKLWPVFVDTNDLEDLLLNASINAMHAMDGGGQLSLATRNEHLSQQDALAIDLDEGDYIVFTITDTGCGMDSETLEHIFEPFFSTKGNLGTGLGLSQIYGFVSRSHGSIKAYSEPDHGTQFVLYFPRYKTDISLSNEPNESSDVAFFVGTETLLVVDDESALRVLMRDTLSQNGYRVLLAENGKEALRILEKETVDGVISDVIMPEMDGYQLANEIMMLYPEVKIQLLSGFNDDRHREHISEDLHEKLLYKPVNSKDLLKRIRALFDADK